MHQTEEEEENVVANQKKGRKFLKKGFDATEARCKKNFPFAIGGGGERREMLISQGGERQKELEERPLLYLHLRHSRKCHRSTPPLASLPPSPLEERALMTSEVGSRA